MFFVPPFDLLCIACEYAGSRFWEGEDRRGNAYGNAGNRELVNICEVLLSQPVLLTTINSMDASQ